VNRIITRKEYDNLVLLYQRAKILHEEQDEIFYLANDIVSDEDWVCDLIDNISYDSVDTFLSKASINVEG